MRIEEEREKSESNLGGCGVGDVSDAMLLASPSRSGKVCYVAVP